MQALGPMMSSRGRCPDHIHTPPAFQSPCSRKTVLRQASRRQRRVQRAQKVLMSQAPAEQVGSSAELQPQALAGNAQALAAEALLLDAVMNKRQKPEAVLTALRTLEGLHKAQANVSDMLLKLAGPWRLVFSGPNKLAFLSYIPVDEDFVINTADSSLALESDLGPFRAKFKGRYEWRGNANEMDFAFNQAQVDFLGRQIWQKEVGFKRKTYSFFWASDVIACARSSAGTLTVMKALRS